MILNIFKTITCLFLLSISVLGNIASAKDSYKVAISETSYPFHFVENKKQQGLMVEFWQLWAQKTNSTVEFVPLPWQQTLEQVEQGEIDFHAGLAFTQERSKRLSFTQNIFDNPSWLYFPISFKHIDDIDKLQPYSIGVVEGSVEQDILHKQYPNLNIDTFASRAKLYDAVLAKKILIFADHNNNNKFYQHYLTLRKLYPLTNRTNLTVQNFGGAVKKNNYALIQKINDGISLITPQEKSALYEKWYSLSNVDGAITLGFSDDVPPFMDADENGNVRGIFIDIWRLWANKTGQQIEFIPVNPKDSRQLVKQGKIDAHVGLPLTVEESAQFNIPTTIFSTISSVYVKNSRRDINTIEDLNGKYLGVFGHANYIDELREKFPGIHLVYMTNIPEMIAGVESGKIDAFLSSLETTNRSLDLANLSAEFKTLLSPNFEISFVSFSQSKNLDLYNVLYEGFKLIEAEEVLKIVNSWQVKEQSSLKKINSYLKSLSNEEVTFLAKNKRFSVGVLSNYKPVEFVNSDGEFSGINADILEHISKQTGVEFDYKIYQDWSVLFHDFQNNKFDVALGITPSVDRKDKMHFSEQYWQTPWGVIGDEQYENNISDLSDLQGLDVAIIQDYKSVNFIKKNYPLIRLRLVADIEEGAELLLNDEIDLYIDFFPILTNMLLDYPIKSFKIKYLNELPPEQNHMAINKELKPLVGIINKGINTLTESELESIRDYWLRVIIEEGYDKNVINQIALSFGIIVFITIGSILFWNRRLKKEVDIRRKLEDKLRHLATHDGLTQLANRGLFERYLAKSISYHKRHKQTLAVLFIDIDGFKAVNDTFGHALGDELLVNLSQILTDNVRESDVVSRFGGDEFVILLKNIDNYYGAHQVAKKIIDKISKPINFSGKEVNVGASIGISLYPDDNNKVDTLIAHADALMYEVKKKTKNSFLSNANR
ncbi:transporter substrate-binding domain-containing protein [Thalassomonas sp. M1454]|uniref:transporter substrate-binding domain-containing protein n=1 Tax=Thalassomonas sp. M1454 TaxID=2594477 RepID=UPI00117C80C1|nr:transporter substrate-binding domain-containing protein [Thalassomonas sp. M1454]TRX56364.1 transporter substrate-binding domain-containing protein [Thalassomonas sp. M1454]